MNTSAIESLARFFHPRNQPGTSLEPAPAPTPHFLAETQSIRRLGKGSVISMPKPAKTTRAGACARCALLWPAHLNFKAFCVCVTFNHRTVATANFVLLAPTLNQPQNHPCNLLPPNNTLTSPEPARKLLRDMLRTISCLHIKDCKGL